MTANPIMQRVVDQIVDQIEAGAGNWTMPWSGQFRLPFNATTGVEYRGGNVIYLWAMQQVSGWSSPRFATLKQWNSIGGIVRKGSKATPIFVWKPIERRADDDDDEQPVSRRGFYRAYHMFNAAQVDGVTFDDQRPSIDVDLDAAATEFIEAMPFVPQPGPPSYNRTLDVVYLPDPSDFITSDHYVSILAHEAAHWTGHPSRLDRTFGKRFGDDAYAMEELVAELSAAFTCALLQQAPAPRPDHAQYLASWCSRLRADPSILFSVGSKAQAATDYLMKFVDDRRIATAS